VRYRLHALSEVWGDIFSRVLKFTGVFICEQRGCVCPLRGRKLHDQGVWRSSRSPGSTLPQRPRQIICAKHTQSVLLNRWTNDAQCLQSDKSTVRVVPIPILAGKYRGIVWTAIQSDLSPVTEHLV